MDFNTRVKYKKRKKKKKILKKGTEESGMGAHNDVKRKKNALLKLIE